MKKLSAASFLAVGVVLAMSFSTLGRSQGRAHAEPFPRIPGHRWPPLPENIVTHSDEVLTGQIPGSGFSIAAGATVPIYGVPADKWLVITQFDWNPQCCDKAYIVELLGGTSTPVLDPKSGMTENTPPLGWTFRPGSEVGAFAVGPGGVNAVSFSFTGYLVDAQR